MYEQLGSTAIKMVELSIELYEAVAMLMNRSLSSECSGPVMSTQHQGLSWSYMVAEHCKCSLAHRNSRSILTRNDCTRASARVYSQCVSSKVSALLHGLPL